MTAEYSAFSRPAFTAEDFERADAETVSDSPMFAPPIYGRDTTARTTRRGVSPAAWVAVPVIALALGAGVYALNRPATTHNSVARLTPGSPTTTMQPAPVESAQANIAPAAAPTPSHMAAETPKAPMRTAEASPRASERIVATRHAAARSSARTSAPSAMDTGENASASVQAAPSQAPAPVVVAPPAPAVSAAPQPAPTPQATPDAPPSAPQA